MASRLEDLCMREGRSIRKLYGLVMTQEIWTEEFDHLSRLLVTRMSVQLSQAKGGKLGTPLRPCARNRTREDVLNETRHRNRYGLGTHNAFHRNRCSVALCERYIRILDDMPFMTSQCQRFRFNALTCGEYRMQIVTHST